MQRLLILRERLKKAAEGALQVTARAREREVACTEDVEPSRPGEPTTASVLLDRQSMRDASYVRIEKIDAILLQQKLALTHAKRELRQVEVLMENVQQRREEKQLRQEMREQEDWVRAKAHKEDNT